MLLFPELQIQHPRTRLDRFDMVITPRHDYYPLTPQAQEQIPKFLRPWITPREPPGRNVVCSLARIISHFSGELCNTLVDPWLLLVES